MSILDQTFLQLSANIFLGQILTIAWLMTEGRELRKNVNKLMKLREKK